MAGLGTSSGEESLKIAALTGNHDPDDGDDNDEDKAYECLGYPPCRQAWKKVGKR